jgi:hypothetical protein
LNRYRQLQEERQRVWAQAKAIADRACSRGTNSTLTPPEERQFDALVARLDRLTAEQRALDHPTRTIPTTQSADPRVLLTQLLGKRYPPEPRTPLQQIVELQRRRGKWPDEDKHR